MINPSRPPTKRPGYRWEYRKGCQCLACPWKGNCRGEDTPHWIQIKEPEMRRKTLDEMMAGMGFNPGDTGPNVTELRKLVERQMQSGMVNRSAGTWAPGNHTVEDRAKAFLEVEEALARGDYEEIDPMTADD